jgi:hypothetical protein
MASRNQWQSGKGKPAFVSLQSGPQGACSNAISYHVYHQIISRVQLEQADSSVAAVLARADEGQ